MESLGERDEGEQNMNPRPSGRTDKTDSFWCGPGSLRPGSRRKDPGIGAGGEERYGEPMKHVATHRKALTTQPMALYVEPEAVRRKLAASYREMSQDRKRTPRDRAAFARMAESWERTLPKR